jgi:hypothetical protein
MREYNTTDDFTFETPFGKLTCKVHFDKGYWWTTTKMSYKCDSLKLIL